MVRVDHFFDAPDAFHKNLPFRLLGGGTYHFNHNNNSVLDGPYRLSIKALRLF
jgi:hypothetical protein